MPLYRSHSGSHSSFHEIRSLHDDERYIIDAYQLHANTCHHCSDCRRSNMLCEQGILLAQNVGKYLYKKNGRFFAVSGHDYDWTNQVNISRGLYAVRNLLAAIEGGFQPGASSTRSRRHSIEIIERQPRHPEASHQAIQYPALWGTNIYPKRKLRKERHRPAVKVVEIEVGCTARRSAVQVAIKVLH